MFAGHYSSAFVAKAVSPQTPLWVLLLAAQFVDVLWVLAILAGIEKARLDPSLPSNPLDLYYMPWTHSLLASLLWAGVAFVASTRWLGLATREAVLVAAVVASHWFLDLVVHRADLTIAGGAPMGFALWDYPVAAWALEMVLVAASVALAMRWNATTLSLRRRWLLLGAGLLALQTQTSFGPVPPSLTAIVVSTLVVYLVVTAAGARVEARA